MSNPKDIPQLVTELYDMSKEYLRQETLEPAKQLGRQAGMGIGGASVMAIGALLVSWGVYYGTEMLLPEGDWWAVLAKVITVVVAALCAMVFAMRIQKVAEGTTE